MADLIKVNIDGRDIEVESGTLIIEAARRLGIVIPTFCYDDRLKSVGACRLCLVEVERAPKLMASCATPVAPNMVVKTNSEKVVKARKGVLEFLLINHPLDCPTCDKGGECPLQNMTLQYGPPTSRYGEDKIRFIDDPQMKFDDVRLGPEIWMNKNRCIICFKCVRIARDLAGGKDLGIFQRGAFAKVDIPTEVQYADEFSGNTVEYCPVGALMSDSFRYKIRTWLLEKQKSISYVCPDGANITVEHNQSKIWRHSSRRNDNVEMGFLSDKDRYSFDIASHPDRILQPLGGDNGSLRKISYNDAVARIVHRIKEENYGKMGLILDTTLTNEEAFSASEYFIKKMLDSKIAISSEIDIENDIETASLGLSSAMADLEKHDLFIIAGCDMAAEHPIIGLRIKKLARDDTPVYFIGPRKMNLGRFDSHTIITKYGHEPEIVKDMLALYQGEGGRKLPDDIRSKLKADLAKAKNVHIIAGYDFLTSPVRYKYNEALQDLAGALDAEFSVLTTETNYLGVRLSGKVNSSLDDLIAAIEDGEIKTLFIAGGDPVNIYPDRKRIINAFKKLDYLIYWGAFMNGTSELATLIFPSLLPTENSGSYLNIERRLQFMKKPFKQREGVTSLIQLFTDIKTGLDAELLYYSAAEVFKSMSAAVPEFADMQYEISEGQVIAGNSELRFSSKTEIEAEAPAEFPFNLTFARPPYYGASGLTAKSPTLSKLTPPQKLIIHVDVATAAKYDNGMTVRLETGSGAVGEFEIEISSDIEPGNLVLHGHSVQQPSNKFMNGYSKPVFARISKA